MAKREPLPGGHRALVNHLAAGGLIQLDESGLAWVSATRSNGYFGKDVVARVRERGFGHHSERFKLVESTHAGKLMATADVEEQARRQERARLRQERKEAGPKPRPRKRKQVESFHDATS